MLQSSTDTDEEANVEYTQARNDSMSKDGSCYSVSTGSFPSHIRSVSPKTEFHRPLETIEKEKSESRCRTRAVYILLALSLVISSLVAVTVAIYQIDAIREEHVQSANLNKISKKEVEYLDETGLTHAAFQEMLSRDGKRTECVHRCTTYEGSKFESSCVHGYCVCNGTDYQKATCLPNILGCKVLKTKESAMAFMWNNPATVYTCENHVEESDIYIIGIYGNHFSDHTKVTAFGPIYSHIKVILASYYPVRWLLRIQDLRVEEVTLISDSILSSLGTEILITSSSNDSDIPNVNKRVLPVGYGDDRHNSNTVDMLKNISNSIGRIKQFIGVTFADEIYLNISGVTQDPLVSDTYRVTK